MRLPVAFSIATCLCATAVAETQTPISELSRADALDRYERVGEEALEMFSLVYTRVDPSLEEFIGEADWDETDREAAACVYDTYAGTGELENLDTVVEETEKTSDYVRTNEDVTIVAIMTGVIDQSVLTPALPEDQADRNMEVSDDCGVIDANGRRLSDPRLMQRLMAIGETASAD